MKKLMVVLLAVASIASADFNINTFSSFGIYDATGTTGVLPNNGDTALIELVFAGANGTIDTGSTFDITLGDAADGDDVVIASTTFTNNGGLYEDYAAATFGTLTGAYQGGGEVYVRLFNTASIADGSRYYVGSLFNAADQDLAAVPAPTPQGYDLGGGLDSQAATGTVVPEPATIGLLGIAGAGLFAARRKTRA
jgi:hypothetical protein